MNYYSNSKAWITSDIFRDVLTTLDKSFHAQGRKVLLFIDNCAAHFLDTSSLKNVKVVFYPPNCTSVVQPLHSGIIKNFKQAYRKQLVQRAVCLMDAEGEAKLKIDVLQAIHFTVLSWQQVTQSTIQNCFAKCGYTGNNELSDMSEDNEIDENVDEDCIRLGGNTAGIDFNAYVSVDQELATCGTNVSDSGNSVNDGEDDDDDEEVEPEPVPSFAEALRI